MQMKPETQENTMFISQDFETKVHIDRAIETPSATRRITARSRRRRARSFSRGSLVPSPSFVH